MATEFGLKTGSSSPETVLETSTANSTPQTDSTTEALKGMTNDTTQEQIDSINANLTAEKPEEALSNVEASNVNVVDTDQLETNGSELTVPKGSTSTGGLSYDSSIAKELDDAEATAVNLKSQVDQKVEENKVLEDARTQTEALRDDVFNAIGDLGNMGDFITDIEEAESLKTKREELTEITNKIRKKQLDFRRKIEGIQDQAGLTRAQKNSEIAEIDRKQSREIADLEIIAMARQGRFNDAQTAVDRKVEIELMERQANLQGLQFLYAENKERFTLVEQRKFEKNILTEERAYQKEYDKLKELEDLKLQMTINATEAGAGVGELEAIQGAKDTKSLFSTPNAQRYMKTKAQMLDEQLQQLNLTKAGMEIQALNAVSDAGTPTGISPITGKAYTEKQSQAGLFGYRIDDANTTLDLGKGLFGSQGGWFNLPQGLRSEERRLFEQAENNFITATLRRESGAQIADTEYAKAREIYIPLHTDPQSALDKKKKARETILNAMKMESVGAFDAIKSSVETQAEATGMDTSSYADTFEQQLMSGDTIYNKY